MFALSVLGVILGVDLYRMTQNIQWLIWSITIMALWVFLIVLVKTGVDN